MADKDAVRKDLPDLCNWMLATDVRIGEALAVHWDDVDLEAGVVHIDHTVIRIKGIGLIRKSTKSLAGARTLPLPAFAVDMLRRRQCASRGSAEFSWVTSRVLRKTAATELDRAGLSARQIADQLGHAKVSMTQDSYMGRRAGGREAANALDRAHRASQERGPGVSSG
jgi:integrase